MDRIKVIKWLLIISLILHAVFILASTLIVAMQSTYSKGLSEIYSGTPRFIIPYNYISSLIGFVIHVTITLIILGMMKDVFTSRIPEVVGIILYSGAFAYISIILNKIQYSVINRNYKMVDWSALTNIINLISMVSFLFNIAITLFIVACAMSWYRKTTLREYRGPEVES